MKVLLEPPEGPPGDPLIEVTRPAEGPPGVLPPPLGVEEPDTRAGPPGELPCRGEATSTAAWPPGPPESRALLSRISRYRRRVGSTGRTVRRGAGFVQSCFTNRVK